MDFPLLKTFEVNQKTTDFLNKKFDQYRNLYENNPEHNCFNDENYNSGYQTSNMLYWDDAEFQSFTKTELLDIISSKLNLIKKDCVNYHWIHMLNYENGGKMDAHKHFHNEDFVIFIYLKTCKSGETVFYLNDFCEEYKERTNIKLLPRENFGAIFSSLVLHEGLFTEENKRIFVIGIRVDTSHLVKYGRTNDTTRH